jgi:hypothetical protein
LPAPARDAQRYPLQCANRNTVASSNFDSDPRTDSSARDAQAYPLPYGIPNTIAFGDFDSDSWVNSSAFAVAAGRSKSLSNPFAFSFSHC